MRPQERDTALVEPGAKAVILAGGRGTRLSEETSVKPKPMVEIGGKPILWHIMKIYSYYGVSNFIIALGYKGEVIKDYFLNYCEMNSDMVIDLHKNTIRLLNPGREGWTITLVDTGMDTQTGGRILRLKRFLEDEPFFFVTYGDGLANIDIGVQLSEFRQRLTVGMLTAVLAPSRFGVLKLDGWRVSGFSEKPKIGEGWINGGFFVFSPRLFDYLEDDLTILERDPLERMAADGQLAAYKHEAFWHPMDTARDMHVLNEMWTRGDAQWKVW